MRTTIRFAAVLAVAAALVPMQAAQAHGIWFAQRADKLALVYGDGAEDLDVVKRLPKLGPVGGYTADGTAVPVKLETEGRLALVNLEAKPAVLTATMNNGLWTRDAKGRWHGKGRDEVPDAAKSGRYFKYNTHLVTLPSGPMRPVAGLALQVVPIGAAFPRHIGDPLTVQVLFEGKPLAGAKVWRDVVTDPDGEPLVTDAQGRVTLPVRNQGLNVVRAEHESASIDPGKTDHTHHFATLSFALEHEPE